MPLILNAHTCQNSCIRKWVQLKVAESIHRTILNDSQTHLSPIESLTSLMDCWIAVNWISISSSFSRRFSISSDVCSFECSTCLKLRANSCNYQVRIQIWGLKQPRWRWRQEGLKFAYLTLKKQYFCPLCTCIYNFLYILTFRSCSRPIKREDRKSVV